MSSARAASWIVIALCSALLGGATIYGIRQATTPNMVLFYVFAGAIALAILITVVSKREMEIKGAAKALILVASVIGFLVCPATWIYLVRNLTYAEQARAFENWHSLGYVALVSSAVVGIASMCVGVIVAFPKKEEASRDNPEAFHGTARFASRKEIAELTLPSAEQLAPGSFILAPEAEQGRGVIALSRLATAQHGIILGGSGTGKSRGYFLPNCAAARDASLVVTDPKSELWNYTSGFHRRARRYAPADPDASEGFNWIPLCRDARIAELCARAVMESGNTAKTDQFWIDAEAAYLAAIFAHTSTLDAPTPLTAYRLFTRQKPEELLEQLLESPSETAREQAIIFAQTDPRIKGSIVPAVASKLQFMRDEKVARFTSASLEPPDFGELRRQPVAVYWCLREQDIARLRPLTSLFFAVMLEQVAGEEVIAGMQGVPITMMLDEFANIGTIPDFATTISLARGRGVAIWIGVQSLAQLEARYGRPNAQTIITNCATKIALHGLDVQTAEYVSRMLGDSTIVVQRESRSMPESALGGHSTLTESRTEHRRPLLTPDEVTRLSESEAIIRTGNRHPMRLAKSYYDEPPRTASAGSLGAARALNFTTAAKGVR
jgi:type IV secretion system protein VirD4